MPKREPKHTDHIDKNPSDPIHIDVPNTKVDKAVGTLIQPGGDQQEGSKK